MRHIDAVIARNKEVGGTFFDTRTVLYFKSKVLPTMYGDGKYFLSYELMDDGSKAYTIRKVLASGRIGVEGMRDAYTSKDEAVTAIRELLNEAVPA